MKNVVEVTDSTFTDEVLNAPMPVLVDFWAPWCMPCKMMTPILEEFAGSHDGKVKVVKLNTDENQNTAVQYGIMSIPSLVFFKDGAEVKRTVGVQPVQALASHLKDLQ